MSAATSHANKLIFNSATLSTRSARAGKCDTNTTLAKFIPICIIRLSWYIEIDQFPQEASCFCFSIVIAMALRYCSSDTLFRCKYIAWAFRGNFRRDRPLYPLHCSAMCSNLSSGETTEDTAVEPTVSVCVMSSLWSSLISVSIAVSNPPRRPSFSSSSCCCVWSPCAHCSSWLEGCTSPPRDPCPRPCPCCPCERPAVWLAPTFIPIPIPVPVPILRWAVAKLASSQGGLMTCLRESSCRHDWRME